MFLVANCLVISFRAVPKTAPKSPNSSASVLKTSSHKRRRWKRAKHRFCWIPRKRWAKMVSDAPKMIVLWNFATKPRLKAILAVWRNLLPYIFQGGLQSGSPSFLHPRQYFKKITASDKLLKEQNNTQNCLCFLHFQTNKKYWYVVHLYCRQFSYVFSNAFERWVSDKLLRQLTTF